MDLKISSCASDLNFAASQICANAQADDGSNRDEGDARDDIHLLHPCPNLANPRQTIDSLPRQRPSNLAVGLNPRLGSNKIASRSDARIFDRRYAMEFVYVTFRGLRPRAKFGQPLTR